MEWWLILIIILTALIAMFITGIPVALGFFIVNTLGSYIFLGGIGGLKQFILSMYDSVTKFSLMPVPLFILMGTIIFHANIASRVLDALDKLLGKIPGRLSILTGMAGTVFGALSGSSMASTALLGSTLGPEMFKRKYRISMIAGPILASGGLSMIIPPSSLAVILASLSQLSIESVLVAGILPGVLMGLFYVIYTIIRCLLQPSIAPSYAVGKSDIKTKLISVVKIIIPTLLLMFLVLGTIFLGVATPSEAAAFGVLGAMLLAAIYRELSIDVIFKALKETLRITGMVFLIIAGSAAFSQILSFSGASRGLIKFVIALEVPSSLLILLMILVCILLGTFMGQMAIMMITLPLFMPLLQKLGVNPYWFAILFLIALQIGQTTPPFGMNLFVLSGIFPEIDFKHLYLSALPYIGCDIMSMIFIAIFPQIALVLPNLL